MTAVNEYGRQLTAEEIARGEHRRFVGGLWEELGKLQLSFLIGQGLQPGTRLLDVGCGCLRGGVHFVRYLEPGRYFGMDVNESLVKAGYEQELPGQGLQDRVPRENLLVESRFQASRFGVSFDMALAASVFTHLPLNHIRVCLIELARCLRPGARFFATFFECPDGHSFERELVHQPGGVLTYADRDPYHCRGSDLHWAAQGLPWDVEYIGEWGHPKAQKMMAFTRKT